MASPIVESMCCVPVSSELTQHILSTFRTVPYNVICLVSSVLGVMGAIYQLRILRSHQQASSSTNSQLHTHRPRILRTHGHVIVKWLAVSDLCAAAGIALRSALWLWDSAAVTGGLEEQDASPGRIFCVAMASWIHYFYTCTYLWTCIYCVDCVRGVHDLRTNKSWYHASAWLIPAALTSAGLFGLYAPDFKCHSSSSNPYIRFLPNYLSTALPLLVVLFACPLLYLVAANTLHTLLASITARYTSTERAVVRGVRRRFLLLCVVFWLCWLPNVLNALLLWLAWDDLPYTTLTVLWYAMAVLNPLQAVLNSFVYPSQSARFAHSSTLDSSPPFLSLASLRDWLLWVITCGGVWCCFWRLANEKIWGHNFNKESIAADHTRDTDVVEYEEYEELSSSEYQSASSSPRTLGSQSPVNESVPLLQSSKLSSYTPYNTRL
uniref:G-protein coupled receptor 143-like n=2 Tax=Hirondellea gigas TaxID=1518452 RepID=A0A6A7FTE6_9CRUS